MRWLKRALGILLLAFFAGSAGALIGDLTSSDEELDAVIAAATRDSLFDCKSAQPPKD